MTNESFPWWSGPLVGAAIDAAWALKSLQPNGEFGPPLQLAIWAAIGAGGGTLLGIAELLSRRQPRGPVDPDRASPLEIADRAPVADDGAAWRVAIALLALLVAWAPLIGLAMAAWAWRVSHGRAGWPRTLSRILTAWGVLFLLYVLALPFIVEAQKRGR